MSPSSTGQACLLGKAVVISSEQGTLEQKSKKCGEPGEFGWKLTKLLNKCSYLINSQNKILCIIIHKKKW
jgi:hypothetical protein